MASRQGTFTSQIPCRCRETSDIEQWRENMKKKEMKEQAEYLRQKDERLRSKWTEAEMIKLLGDAMSD